MQPIGKLNANRRLWSAGAVALASSLSTAGRPLDVAALVANLAPAAIVHDVNLPAIPSLQQHRRRPGDIIAALLAVVLPLRSIRSGGNDLDPGVQAIVLIGRDGRDVRIIV